MISLPGLIAAGFRPTQARSFLGPLVQVFAKDDVSTVERQAAFVAQAGIESAMFVELEEDLTYRDAGRIRKIFPREVTSDTLAATLVGNPKALANTVYSGRNGNGNFASGDGWTYRGRGFGITGRANYAYLQSACGEPYLANPDLVATPTDACLTFGAYWTREHCNGLADRNDIDGITLAINGRGMQAKDERKALFVRCLQSFR